MKILIFGPKEEKKLKMAVRAAKLHEYLKNNGIRTVSLPSFNFKKISFSTLSNYLKLIYFILTKKKNDIVLFENERQVRLLKLFKRLGFPLALDIRDNRALQHSIYMSDDSIDEIDCIQKVLLANIDVCDYVFTVTQSCKELYPQKYHNKIFVVENASDPYLFKYSKLPRELRVGFISGIAPGRGLELLIEAMNLVKKRLPDVKLLIAGTLGSPLNEGIEYYFSLKKKFLSDDWITFREDVYYSINAWQFFRECYLTVIPHPDHIHYQTTLPVKLFDSLACGRPVVSTNCKETAKVLLTYQCGSVADFNSMDLAAKITNLLLDRNTASRMGANGRRAVERVYNWNNMARKMINIIRA
jgi:glycosyltransferase involved in cell wall biosynthesis